MKNCFVSVFCCCLVRVFETACKKQTIYIKLKKTRAYKQIDKIYVYAPRYHQIKHYFAVVVVVVVVAVVFVDCV